MRQRAGTAGFAAALVTVGLVAALTVLTLALTVRALTGSGHLVGSLVGLGLGGVLATAWLIRLWQWRLAARVDGQDASIVANLAQSPHDRGGRYRPAAYAVWLTLTVPPGGKRYQRVLWQPWMRELTGTHHATVRSGPGPVSVVDVLGHGRLWPTSFTLRRRPFGVAFAPFASAHRQPRQLGAGLFAVIAVPVFFGVWFAAFTGTVWGAVYVVLAWLALLLWFGVAPPGWLPRPRGPTPRGPTPRDQSGDQGRR